MNELSKRIVEELARGPMLLSELTRRVGGRSVDVKLALEELMRAGYVHRRRSGRFWIYWLDGNGHISPADWEMVEGLTVLQVLSEAAQTA